MRHESIINNIHWINHVNISDEMTATGRTIINIVRWSRYLQFCWIMTTVVRIPETKRMESSVHRRVIWRDMSSDERYFSFFILVLRKSSQTPSLFKSRHGNRMHNGTSSFPGQMRHKRIVLPFDACRRKVSPLFLAVDEQRKKKFNQKIGFEAGFGLLFVEFDGAQRARSAAPSILSLTHTHYHQSDEFVEPLNSRLK